MKVVSPQILHKTDVGGVKVGVNNVADVKNTFNDMYGRLSKKKGVDVWFPFKISPAFLAVILDAIKKENDKNELISMRNINRPHYLL